MERSADKMAKPDNSGAESLPVLDTGDLAKVVNLFHRICSITLGGDQITVSLLPHFLDLHLESAQFGKIIIVIRRGDKPEIMRIVLWNEDASKYSIVYQSSVGGWESKNAGITQENIDALTASLENFLLDCDPENSQTVEGITGATRAKLVE